MDSAATVQLYVALRLFVVPAAAAIVAVVAARVTAAQGQAAARLLGAGAGVGAVAAVVGFAGVPPIPPIDTIGWIAPGTALALVLLVLAEGSAAAVGAVLVGLGALSAYLVGRPAWSASTPAWIAPIAVAVAASGASFGVAAERLHPVAVLAALSVVLAGGAVACVASHSALLALILGGFAVAVGATAAAALVLRVAASGRTLPGVIAVGGGAVLVYARLYASLPALPLLLLGGATVTPAILALAPRFRGRSIVAVALSAALAAAAAGLALKAGADAEGGADAEEMYYR
jgi:hypothetical protein